MSTKISENVENNEESKEQETKQEHNQNKIELQLGDIIKIMNPKNERINDQEFFIQYIDPVKMFLLNADTGETIKLKISPEGIIGDGNITELIILSRSDSASYAIQNGLTINKWINIHFGGEYPVIITAEITNLEDDMIEIRTIDGDTLYINFDYKGIPEDLPIDFIELREKPYESNREEQEQEQEQDFLEQEKEQTIGKHGEFGEVEEGEIVAPEELERERIMASKEDIQLGVPTNNIRNQLREFIIRADQIVFGKEELGPIRQLVDVEKEKQRYSIDDQVSDLLDDLLSTIPNPQRTQKVLNNIHIMIERFKQLREEFSVKDEYGNIDGIVVFTANYKPLINHFRNFKQNLYWLLPVVKNVKKLYDVNVEDIEEENTDIINIDAGNDLESMIDIIKTYKSNSIPSEQNKYVQLYTDLNPYFTPFDLVDDETAGILIQKYVKGDINVIIDNLEQMESSVSTNNQIKTRRFVVERYTTSLTKLDNIEVPGNKTKTVVVDITNPDLMSIKSFITLPEPVVRFSKINLPGTNILDKANLNLSFFNYWQFLRKKTHVNENAIENLEQELEFNENNFVNNIKNYVLNLSEEERKGLTQNQIYKKFLEVIIPKTRILFNLMKKYINGKLSIVDVVGYLEPFLIYTEDLTYKQYEDITAFINEKISQYNRNNEERSRLFAILNKIKSEPLILTNAYSIITSVEQKNNLRDEVQQNYDVMDEKMFTNSEILRKFMTKDYTRFYTTTLALQSGPLMFPSEFSTLFETEQDKLDKKLKMEQGKDTCNPTIVAKQYSSIEQLQEDNEKTIYFDKKFDKTNYGLLDEYEKDMMRMTPEEFIAYLIQALKKKQKINEVEAEYLAETLIDGHKKVVNGQYAILYYGPQQQTALKKDSDFFVRTANKWELDNAFEKGTNTTDSDILCDLQEKCISESSSKQMDNCESITVNRLSLQHKMLKDVINEFDSKYKISKEEFEKTIREKYDYLLSIMPVLSKIETTNMLKYSNMKYNLGVNTEDDKPQAPASPYSKVLNLILSQKDFVKKQNDIIRFVNSYTRPPITDRFGPLNEKESEHWLYCIVSNVKLLPVFRFEMATAFITNPGGYNEFIDLLISRIGKESDDGDSWTAVGSGWTIRKADFDTEEGYEEGFKVVTRAALEQDVGNAITSVLSSNKEIVKYTTPETKTISNIVNAVSHAMGLNIEYQKEFIMNCVSGLLVLRLRTEQEYKLLIKKMSEQGKKVAPYKDYYNSALMYYTLGAFLIAIQTSIPSIKTRKTHPGCIRSFDGYPFGGTGDFSSLNYLSCVVHDIRNSTEPWNILKKKETIQERIKAAIDELLELPEVKRKFEEKTDEILLAPEEKIPEEHDIANWRQFLPPLFPFRLKKLLNVSHEFKRALLADLRNGSPNQREKILVLESKVIHFSLAIQEKIQNVVKQKPGVLKNSNNEPYLENACCQTKQGVTTVGYFIENDGDILEYNDIVQGLTDLLSDITSYTKSGLFCSEVNTKNIYPPISNTFDEKTIYLAFIYFCKFKTLIPIPEDLLPLCAEKPDYNFLTNNDSIDEMIRKLKDHGRNYTNETFLRLLQLIGRNNIIHIDLDVPVVSSATVLNNLLETIDQENDEVIDEPLKQKIQGALNTYDIATPDMTEDVRELNNYLSLGIRSMKEDIIDFIERNKASTITTRTVNKTKEIIRTFSDWKIDSTSSQSDNLNNLNSISSDSTYTIIEFYKTFITNLVTIFPNIILSRVDYSNTFIPRYMNLSNIHSHKISNYIKMYYEDLKVFYGNEKLQNMLNVIQTTTKNIELLSQNTPSFSTIKYGEEVLRPMFDERTSKNLFEFYLLRVIIQYMDLSDDDALLATYAEIPDEVQDLVSVDFLDESERREDFVETTRTENLGILNGNKKELKQLVSQLLIVFLNIMDKHKDTIDISYEQIRDNIFKLKEIEKNKITDRLKSLTDESRDLDTMLKINKLGVWGKGLQKGLTVYDKEAYEEEEEFRDEMEKAERNIRKKNSNVTNDNIDQFLDDYLEEQREGEDIEREAYDLEYLNEDFDDGNFNGYAAPEEEPDDYTEYE